MTLVLPILPVPLSLLRALPMQSDETTRPRIGHFFEPNSQGCVTFCQSVLHLEKIAFEFRTEYPLHFFHPNRIARFHHDGSGHDDPRGQSDENQGSTNPTMQRMALHLLLSSPCERTYLAGAQRVSIMTHPLPTHN
jgi:hypothetical protein